jgi:hypothetical protein
MGIRDVRTAPQSPWQNPFTERLIGSIRRECLDHVLVLSERHLRRILTRYVASIIGHALTARSRRMHRMGGQSRGRRWARSCGFLKSAVYIIATSAGQHNPASTVPRPTCSSTTIRRLGRHPSARKITSVLCRTRSPNHADCLAAGHPLACRQAC